ncbi:hypothetical protein GQ472_00395 [archaeon]|nr:hypothetical protein [archaeon]
MIRCNFKKSRRGVVLSSSLIIILSVVLIIMIILMTSIFNLNTISNVATGHMNMQYSTDAGRELILILSSDCDVTGYENYSVTDLIGVYVSGTLDIKENIYDDMNNCIEPALEIISDVNQGVDKDGNEVTHYMYFYILYGGQKYLEMRRPNIDIVNIPIPTIIIPWGLSIPVKLEDAYPVNPRYYSETMNDRFSVQIPLADPGNMQFGSVTVVLEEWSDDPWTTLTLEQQGLSDDYEY